jgi:hypothetical protein
MSPPRTCASRPRRASQLAVSAPFLFSLSLPARAVPATGTPSRRGTPDRGQCLGPGTGGSVEARAAVTLTYPKDEVKSEEQVFDALGTSFDRHGAGCLGLGRIGVALGALAAGTEGIAPDRGAGRYRLASGCTLKKCHSLRRAARCGAHVL